jgi:Ca-activated chloride channel family protein
MKLLVDQLREQDKVAKMVYKKMQKWYCQIGSNKTKIKEAIDNLAGGSTAGGAGIKLAYKTARNIL